MDPASGFLVCPTGALCSSNIYWKIIICQNVVIPFTNKKSPLQLNDFELASRNLGMEKH
jgi:hypothetical protein